MNHGFIRVSAGIPTLKVADVDFNAEQIINQIKEAEKLKAQIIVFPELCITSYTCADLFNQRLLLESAMIALKKIIDETASNKIVAIVGLPIAIGGKLFNCASVISQGHLLGIVPKTYIPNYGEFYEKRWFESGADCQFDSIGFNGEEVPFGTDLLFSAVNFSDVTFGVEICEDLWVPIPPSSYHAINGATIIFNLSASNEVVGKSDYRKALISQQSARTFSSYVYVSSSIDESSTDLVFGGHALITDNGQFIAESKRFSDENQIIFSDVDVERLINERLKNKSFTNYDVNKNYRFVPFEISSIILEKLARKIDSHPFVPCNSDTLNLRCEEIFSIQISALVKRIKTIGINKIVVGISGGLDSALALLVAVKTFDRLNLDRNGIISITMPGFGTTDETHNNAIEFMKSLKVTIREIDIKPACIQHFKDILHEVDIHDITYENVQARERTQLLMDISNKEGGMVLGTGDLSELALGWCTYNGDHMSMYAINCGIPKTLVKFLVEWVADNMSDERTKSVLHKIINTPISPELLPPDKKGKIEQKTEDIVGPYELHDFFMYHIIRYGATPKKVIFLSKLAFEEKYSEETIKKWLKIFIKRFFTQQFKRSCIPDGPKVGTISLSPRGDWRMPSDASANLWLKEIEE